MKIEVKNFFLLLLISMINCSTHPKEQLSHQQNIPNKPETKIKEIVLINGGRIDRCEMSELIQRISECNPKVIGINFLFVGKKEANCDSLMRASIIDSDKVVLVEDFNGENHIGSNFTDVAFLTGLNGLIQSDDGVVTKYNRLIDYRGKWELTFPFLLALQLDKSQAAVLSSKVTPQDYPVTIQNKIEQFKVLDFSTDLSKQCDALRDKIVIIGYLGPEEEDIFQTKDDGSDSLDKTYGTVILANIIIDILKDID